MKLLTVAETAERLGVKVSTVRLWLAQRKLGHVKLSRAVRVPETEVERIIHDNMVPPRAPSGNIPRALQPLVDAVKRKRESQSREVETNE